MLGNPTVPPYGVNARQNLEEVDSYEVQIISIEVFICRVIIVFNYSLKCVQYYLYLNGIITSWE